MEKCGESVGSGLASVIRVEGEDEGVVEAVEVEGDGFVAVGGAEHTDGPVPGGSSGESVYGSFGDDDLGVTALDRAHPGELGVGSEISPRVEVAGPVLIGVRDADLGVDGLAIDDGGQDDTHGSGHAVGTVLVAGTEVDADAVLGEDISGDVPEMGEPSAQRSALGLPQPIGAFVDVALEAFGVSASLVHGATNHSRG